MSKHLFGLIVTPHGTAANNRGETEGNITTLQKILWNQNIHTTVSAEALRFAIRWYWQKKKGGDLLNRNWDDKSSDHSWKNPDFTDWEKYIDDDVLGFMSAKAAKEESNEGEKKGRARGTCDKRRARLEITRAISLTPFVGDITFNAASPGATPSASRTGKDPVPYGTEVHATRYQYGIAVTPDELQDKSRILDILDAVVELSEVAGNQARFLYDFSPESVIFRWTDDFAPRMLYGYEVDNKNELSIAKINRMVNAGDIKAAELIIGGPISMNEECKGMQQAGAKIYAGVKAATEEVKAQIKKDLHF